MASKPPSNRNRNRYAFSPIILDQDKHEKRRVIKQLPAVHQTETLQKFFGASADNLFDPGKGKSINGYVGQIPLWYDPDQDYYLAESTSDRDFYQLEASMVSKSSEGEITNLLFYPDLINQLRFQGGIVNNHHRLFAQDFYTWCPPIDIDKILNFRQYVWLPTSDITISNDVDAIPLTPLDTAIAVYGPTAEYEANGSLTSYYLPGYGPTGDVELKQFYDLIMLKKSLIIALVDGTARPFTYIDGNDFITFTNPPADDAEVKISVYSDIENTLGLEVAEPKAFGGQVLSSNMRIKFVNDISSDFPPTDVFIIEGVGTSVFATNESTSVSDLGLLTDPDYLVMARGADNGNEWSSGNRWFHISTLSPVFDPDYISSIRATRPIVEFDKNIELYNYGLYRRLSVDAVNDAVIDLQTYIADHPTSIVFDNVRFTAQSGTITITDLITNVVTTGHISARILMRNTENNLVNERVYAMTNQGGILTVVLEADGLNPTGEPVYGESLKVNYGTLRGKNLHWIGTSWSEGQTKTTVNQAPLFMLYDLNGNALNDIGLYPSSDFAGSRIFGYKVDTTGTRVNDPVLGFPLLHDNKGQILFENYVSTESYSYLLGGKRPLITGFYFHKVGNIDPDLELLSNDWFKSTYESRQYMIDRFVADGKTRVFVISQEPADDVDGEPSTLQVTIGRVGDNKNFERIILTEDQGFIRIGRKILIDSVQKGDIVEVRTFNPAQPPEDATGHYEIPFNLQANADNAEVSEISKGDFYDQFSDIIRSQDAFVGAEYAVNNYRDTAKLKNRGKFITQQSAGLLKTMLLASETQFDITSAIRFVDAEYTRFKAKFQQKILEYSTKHKFTGSVTLDTWINTALEELNRGKTKDFPFYLSGMAVNDSQNLPSFIPATPSYLGVYPLFIPEMVTGTTAELDAQGQLATLEVYYVKGHDGSWTQARNFEVAQVLLALEERIYLSVPDNIRVAERPVFDWQVSYSDQYRNNDYSYSEYLKILQPSFERWVVITGQDYRENTIYDMQDPWTWNWSSIPSVNGDVLPGHWRGIYEKFFGTQRPDLTPWESLGFTTMPAWWTSRYGPAPYTSDNTMLWTDLERGYVHAGPRQGINKAWARPGFRTHLPVDQAGNLMHPGSAIELDTDGIPGCGIAQDTPLHKDRAKAWAWGDLGPVEQDWRRSSHFPFAVAMAGYLMKPAQFIELGWNTKDLTLLFKGTVNEQLLNMDTMGRPSHKELQIHGEVLDDFSLVKKVGIQQWIADLMISKNTAIAENFADKIRGLGAQLAYKVGGFTDNATLVVVSDAFGRVPSEDAAVTLYRSPSIREETYSGVAVEYVGNGSYRIFGYDSLNPYFSIIPGDEFGNKLAIGESNRAPVVPGWRPFTYYTVNLTLKFGDLFYRCLTTHTSGEGFEPRYWIEVARPQYADGVRLSWNVEPALPINVQTINYGTVFKTPQTLADFISGYDRYLQSRGWVFDAVDSDGYSLKDWKQALRDFVTWSQDESRESGDFIALSPGSKTTKFVTELGAIQPIEQIVNGLYAIVDQSGQPIAPNDTRVVRSDGELVVTCDAASSGIFGLRLYISEYEHAIVFNNKTIFNDTIYSPLLNIHQPRLRIQGFKSVDWVGRIDAPGFIVTSNALVPNFERAADDFRRFFDVESIENKKLQDRARANFGYEEREYLNNLLLTPTNQFEFFQGMIQQKGSPTSMRRLLRSNFIRHNKGLKLFEEWAFRIGDYGGPEAQPSLDVMIKQSDFKHNPQLIEFRTETTQPTSQYGVISIVDIKDEHGKLVELDKNWSWRPDLQSIRWPNQDYSLAPYKKSLLPTAGYVKLDEIRWPAATIADFEALYQVNNQPFSAAPIISGDRAWVYGLDKPLLSDGTVDPLAWATYKFLDTGLVVQDSILAPNDSQACIVSFAGSGHVKPNYTDQEIRDNDYGAEDFYLTVKPSMVPHIADFKERIYIGSTETETPFYQSFVPKFGGKFSIDINGSSSRTIPLVNLVSNAGMWVKSIKIKVTEAFDAGSIIEIGTEADGKIDYYVQVYHAEERDYGNEITYTDPEQVVVATPPVHYVDQDVPTTDVKLIRVGRVLDFCGETTVEWSYQRVAADNTAGPWEDGGTLTFVRPADASEDTSTYYTQNITVPLTADNDQTIRIRTITNPTAIAPQVNIAEIEVQRTESSNLNFADLTTEGEYYFRWSASASSSQYATFPSQCVTDLGRYMQASLTSMGIRGKATIEVEYFYTKGIELQVIDDGEVVPLMQILTEAGGHIYTWIPSRYPTVTARDLVDQAVWTNGDIVEVDSGNDTTKWSVFKRINGTWTEIRRQNRKVITDLLTNAAIYDSYDNELKLVLQTYDPGKGFIPGAADRELYYKLISDPAVYEETGLSGKGKVWGHEEEGRLWWNLGTMRYLDYEIYDDMDLGTNYRWKNWGRIAPNINVDIMQWTRSTVQPAEWNEFVRKNALRKVESYSEKPTGVVVDATNTSYVTAFEWNDDLQADETVYYFWVKNPTVAPSNPERKLSAQQVSNLIANPIGSDIPFIAAIDTNKIIIGGIRQFLNDQDTILKIKWHEDTPVVNNHHKQWIILREEDERNTIEDTLWNKMRDSIVGWDNHVATSSVLVNSTVGSTDLTILSRDANEFSTSGSITCAGIKYYYTGRTANVLHNLTPPSNGITAGASVSQADSAAKQVPDIKLPKAQQLGGLYRPRQSWFPTSDTITGTRPNRAAREALIECLNDIFSAQPFIDQWVNWENVFGTGEAYPASDRYVTTALDIADLKLLVSPTRNAVQPDECVLIENTVEAGGFWTLWRLLQNGSDTSTRRFVLVDFQKWRMQEGEMWNPTDWYATGWSAANFPNYRFPTYKARDAAGNLDFTLLKGTLVQIDTQSVTDPRWSWDVYTSTTKYQVALQAGTFKLGDAFYNEARIEFGNKEIFGTNGLLDPVRKDVNGNVIGLITPERISELSYYVENRDGSRELEFMINSMKTMLLDTLQKNRMFFTMVKSAFRQSKVVDWAFKTSFLYLGGYSEELRQSPVAFKDQIDNVISYLEEVKPFHVKIREYVRRLSYGPDLAKLSMTDFDKPVYLDNDNYRLLDVNNPNDVTVMLANRPWKDWILNYQKENYDLNEWDASWNPIRRMNVELLFDRIACGTIKGWDTSPWDPPHTLFSQKNAVTESLSSLSTKYRGQYLWNEELGAPSATLREYPAGNRNPFNDTAVETINERNRLVRDGTVRSDFPGTIVTVTTEKRHYMWSGLVWIEFEAQGWDQDVRSGAASRVEEAYAPTTGMARKDAPNLIAGCDFDGTVITDTFQNGGWDQFEWDSTGLSSEYQDRMGRDLDTIDGTTLGTPNREIVAESDIKIDGNAFAQPAINGGRPEELVHIRGRDSGLITVIQRSDADTIAAIPAFNIIRSQLDPTIVYMNTIRAKRNLPPMNASHTALPASVTVGHADVGPLVFRLVKNLNNEWEQVKLEDKGVSFVGWDQNNPENSRGGQVTIRTADGVFPFHDPKNPSAAFLDKVKLSKAYRSNSSINLSTPGNKTFIMRDVNNSGVLKQIPFGLMGDDVRVVIENSKKPNQRALARIVAFNKSVEASNWNGSITVEILNVIGAAPDDADFKSWNILPVDSFDQPGVVWIGTSRFTYSEIEPLGNDFILKNAFLSANSLNNLSITTVEVDGKLENNITLTNTGQVYDGSALSLMN